MFFPFAQLGRTNVRGAASRLALALALAGGAVVGSAAIAPAAYAQSNSRGFAAAYSPVAELVEGDMPNWAAARDRFETLVAAIENDDDRNIAGNFALQIGRNLTDQAIQRRGLEMMLQSGKVEPERVGLFHYILATMAYRVEEYAAARSSLEAALTAGYAADDPRGLIMQSYFEENRISDGITYLASVLESGVAPKQDWFLSALQASYDAELRPETLNSATMLVRAFPTEENWMKALQVINEINDFEQQEQLDLLRLMRATHSMSQRAEYLRYVYQADSRKVPDEVLGVLAEGLAAGHFTATGDDDYTSELATARSRSALDQQNMASLLRDGERGDQLDAMSAGDISLSQQNFARAESFYQIALTKGAERNLALTRIGMAQQLQGNNAAAIATFGQVTGVRQPIAQLWALRAELQSAGM